MPYYCTVPRCTSMAGKAKNVSFHQFPRDEELALLWNKILKRGKPYTKYSKVCSLHFKPEDYTITSVGKNKGQWRTLRKDAIPSRNLPSESPLPSPRRNCGTWVQTGVPGPVVDARVQQHMAQAIYMQTMMAMAASNGSPLPTNSNTDCNDPTIPHTSRLPLPELEQLMKQSDSIQEYHRSQDFLNQDKNTSYKCDDCSKCFKDPDVFTLHRRSHNKTNTSERLTENISNIYEKENFNANSHLTKQETLRANPILANLLKSGIANPNDVSNANIFDTNNILSIENQIMTTLASNVESYIRNLTTILNHEGKDDKDAVVKSHEDLPTHSDDDNNGGDEIKDENHFNIEAGANSIKEEANCEFSEDTKFFGEVRNSNLETESWEGRDIVSDGHDFIKKEEEDESRNNDSCDSLYQNNANEVSERRNEDLGFESRNNGSNSFNNEYKDSVKEESDSRNKEDCYEKEDSDIKNKEDYYEKEDSDSKNKEGYYENVEKHETESRMHIVLRRESENEDLNDSKDSNNLVIDECA